MLNSSLSRRALQKFCHIAVSQVPRAAKWTSAAASWATAKLHNTAVSTSVPIAASHFLAPMRRTASPRRAEKTVPARAKKLPNGRVKHPARASSGANAPVCPWASMPKRASTHQMASRCHASSCTRPRK